MDIVAKLLKMTAQELAGASVDEYIIIRLKQLAVNFMFEFMEALLHKPICKGFFSDIIFK